MKVSKTTKGDEGKEGKFQLAKGKKQSQEGRWFNLKRPKRETHK